MAEESSDLPTLKQQRSREMFPPVDKSTFLQRKFGGGGAGPEVRYKSFVPRDPDMAERADAAEREAATAPPIPSAATPTPPAAPAPVFRPLRRIPTIRPVALPPAAAAAANAAAAVPAEAVVPMPATAVPMPTTAVPRRAGGSMMPMVFPLPAVPPLKSFATGSPFIRETGPALLHQGEAVIPASIMSALKLAAPTRQADSGFRFRDAERAYPQLSGLSEAARQAEAVNAKVSGSAQIDVNLRGLPKGTRTAIATGGIFDRVRVNSGMQMVEAAM